MKIKTYMNGIAKIAVSRTMTEPGWNNARIVSDPVSELTKLKQQDGKTIFIFGSAELADGMMKAGLIDEVRVCLVPVILGERQPAFQAGRRPGAAEASRILDDGKRRRDPALRACQGIAD